MREALVMHGYQEKINFPKAWQGRWGKHYSSSNYGDSYVARTHHVLFLLAVPQEDLRPTNLGFIKRPKDLQSQCI